MTSGRNKMNPKQKAARTTEAPSQNLVPYDGRKMAAPPTSAKSHHAKNAVNGIAPAPFGDMKVATKVSKKKTKQSNSPSRSTAKTGKNGCVPIGSAKKEEKYSKLGPAGMDKKKVDIFYLMEKYGPKSKKIGAEAETVEKEPEPVGFVIKFSLAQAYKALEKQEVEASLPQLPVRRSRRRRRTSPHDVDEITTSSKMIEKSKREQALEKLKAQNQEKLIWKGLAKSKAPAQEEQTGGPNCESPPVTNTRKGSSNRKSAGVSVKTKGSDEITVIKDSVRFVDEIGMSKTERLQARKEDDAKRKNLVSASSGPNRSRFFSAHMQPGMFDPVMDECETIQTSEDMNSSSMDTLTRMLAGASMGSGSVTMETCTSGAKSPTEENSSVHSGSKILRPGKGRPKTAPKARKMKVTTSSEAPSGTTGASGAKAGGESTKYVTARRVPKYLYHMCNCRNIARPETLNRLVKKRSNVAGVIEVFGCSGVPETREQKIVCPFCSVFPQEKIHAWLDDLESDAEP